MFEPIARILDKHAGNLTTMMGTVLAHLSAIAQNTEARTESVQYGDYSGTDDTGDGTTAEVKLYTREGYFWRVNQAAITGGLEGNCAVYLGTINPESLIDVITNTGKNISTAKYYVPRNSVLIFHFYEQPENQVCTAHIQVNKLTESPEYTERLSISHDVSEIDKRLEEPARHRPPRTEKPSPEELRTSIHS